jgi:hypothetical protein
MASNLDRRLDRLEETLKALGRGETDPLYARGSFDEARGDALDRLEVDGQIQARDRGRVTLIYREIIDPPAREEEPLPEMTAEPSGGIFGGDGRPARKPDIPNERPYHNSKWEAPPPPDTRWIV